MVLMFLFCGKSWVFILPYEKHLLTEKYYTSDYDLSNSTAVNMA
jgi:hypothetical protein